MGITKDEFLQDDIKKIPENYNQPLNIKYVLALETDDSVILVANPDKTTLEHYMILHKTNFTISYSKDNEIPNYTKKIPFSLFMGFMNFKGNLYLIFVDKVKTHEFGRFNVFEINSVSVFTLNGLIPHIDLSLLLSEYYKSGFLFSYDIDLSDSENYKAAFNPNLDPFKHPRNFLYFANRNLLTACSLTTIKEWSIPVIFGKIYKEITQIDESRTAETIFLYKASVLDIYPKFRQDKELLEDFYSPASFHSIDAFFLEKGIMTNFGVVLNDFPAIAETLKIKSKGDFFNSKIHPKKIPKYFEFMRYFNNTKNFIFSGSYEKVELMKSVEEIAKTNNSVNSIIKTMLPLKTEYYSELVLACERLADNFITIDFLSEEERSEFNDITVSICTDRPLEELEECYFQVYLNFISHKILNRKKQFDSSTENKLQKLFTSQHLRSLRLVIKNFFDCINTNVNYISDIQTNLKPKIKDMDIKLSWDKVISHVYGPSDGISKYYKKIISTSHYSLHKTQPMNIAIITHNCGGTIFDMDIINDIYYHQLDQVKSSDLVIIGLQEIIEMKSKNWSKIISNNNEDSLKEWIDNLTRCFEDFEIVTNVSMLGLLSIVLLRKSMVDFFDIAVFEHEQIKMGLMNMANKGGLFLRLKINFEHIGIFNCHLAAGFNTKSYMKRQENLLGLANYLELQKDLTLSFILGDMNFRTSVTCSEAEKLISQYIKDDPTGENIMHLQQLLKSDELIEYMKYSKGTVLERFVEAPITFVPSYKWVIGKNVYNYDNEKKAPSW